MARNALGKGLSALIREPEPQLAPAQPPPPSATPEPGPGPQEVDTDLIEPSPYQPRMNFREESLEELARSIRSTGIIQPLILRRLGNRYQLLAGERRWRAAQRAGLDRVPAVIRDVPDEQALEITLVENLQREDLNPVEQARAFERLIEEFHLTQEEVAERTGKDRATVANTLRLLKLEKTILDWMEEGKLTAGHGRALLSVAESQARLVMARRAARGALTVRQIERLAARRARRKEAAPEKPLDPNIRAAIEELQRALGTKVTLSPQRKGRPGRLIIEYYDEAHLQGLYERLVGK